MRALCGAIITAAALIGLGLLDVAIGLRYQGYTYHSMDNGAIQWVLLKNLDTPFLISLTTLLIFLAIGLGITILGLAYHHHRRLVEMTHQHALHLQRLAGEKPTTEKPSSTRVTV